MQKSILKYLFSLYLLIAFFISNCSGDYRPKAKGQLGEVWVVMSSTQQHDKLKQAIKQTFAPELYTLTNPEPAYTLHYLTIETEANVRTIQEKKNIIIAAPINEEDNTTSFLRTILGPTQRSRIENKTGFIFQLDNVWRRDQWVLCISANSYDELTNIITTNKQLIELLDEKENQRWTEDVYDRGEQIELAQSLEEKYGWKLRIQHDYQLKTDTTNYVELWRSNVQNDRWISIWWENDIKNQSVLNDLWIDTIRDKIYKDISINDEKNTFIKTEYRREVKTTLQTETPYTRYETLGTWHLEGGAMGGIFVQYTYYIPQTKQIFVVLLSQFAPKYNKMRFFRQFQTIGRTLSVDPTFKNTPS